MRAVAVAAVLALLAATLAGCAGEDPLRYPRTSTTSSSASSTSRTSTSAAPAPNATVAPPTANLTVSPANGTAPLNVTLELSGNVTQGNLTWTLLFGDGNTTNGTSLPATLVHLYSGGGNYTPTLTVSDGTRNATATANLTVLPGTAGFAPGLDPACQRPDAVGHDAVGWVDDRGSGGTWLYEEANAIPGLQLSMEPSPAGDTDPLGVANNCQNGDALIF